MKLRCAILDDYQGAARSMADWASLGTDVHVTLFREHMQREDEVARALQEFQIIVIMRERTPFSASLFARLPNLRLLVTSGMRNASIDLAAAAAHSVVVSGTASASSPPAELTWALILGLARHVVQESTNLRTNGPWQTTVGVDLKGKQLGLLGLGNIGTQVARVGLAFGMDVMAWSQNLTQDRATAAGVQLAPSKNELLDTSDFVSIHLVLSERTDALIGAAEIARMRPSSFLINTSRAAIVDGLALVDALRHERIAGAGLDVFDTEPLVASDALRSLPNVLATPHLGYVTQANYQTYFGEAVENIRAFLEGSPIRMISSGER